MNVRPIRAVFTIVFLAIMLCAGPAEATRREPPSIYDDFLNAVVVVESSVGEGTGFFINDNGLLITNHHVVEDDHMVRIGLREGGVATGIVLAVNEALDLALVSIPRDTPIFLTFANWDEGGVGSDVIAIGTAKGLSWSVSRGIVSGIRSGLDFDIGANADVQLIQTDAAINSGNSGGPLILTDSGKVIGVNTISFHKDIAEGISFAVSAADVRSAFSTYLSDSIQPLDGEPPQDGRSAEDAVASWFQDPEASAARLRQRPADMSETQMDIRRIILENAKYDTLDNLNEGPLLILTGRAKNSLPEAVSYIRLRGSLYDAAGRQLTEEFYYCGNVLTREELTTMTLDEIQAALNIREGLKGANMYIQSGQSVAFMVVFGHLPPKAAEWTVEVVSSY